MQIKYKNKQVDEWLTCLFFLKIFKKIKKVLALSQRQCCRMVSTGGKKMKYRIKWIEDNLGISRKAIIGYEKIGLMPKNENSQYREYNDEDLDRIWTIKVLNKMGYELKEIVDIVNMGEGEDFDFEESLNKKIIKMEEDIKDKERYLGYAKMIKLTGRFPHRPKDMGSVTFNEFKEKSMEEWNVNNDKETQEIQSYVNYSVNSNIDEENEIDLQQLIDVVQNLTSLVDAEDMIYMNTLYKEIAKREELGESNFEVQMLVKLIYDKLKENKNIQQDLLSVQDFARHNSSQFIAGDIAKDNEKKFGKEGCRFIADAIEYFGKCDKK